MLILLGVGGRQPGVGLLTTFVVLILLVQVAYDIYSRLQESGPGSDEELADRI